MQRNSPDLQPATEPPRHYRGRIAPSPTGYLHLGHARTFWIAQARAVARQGTLILRNDDLDGPRCKPEFVRAMFEDLRWFGFNWQEGPDIGGPFKPYNQSERTALYRNLLNELKQRGVIYPCTCSRKDIAAASRAPHASDDELVYPGTCRGRRGETNVTACSWRFRVPDGDTVEFIDHHCGRQHFIAGRDFGDFVVWRPDDVPAYQLACVADDVTMQITEVVRGKDLLLSTARQLLLYRALGLPSPEFFHCDLLTDASGRRLAKRDRALGLRHLKESGAAPEELRKTLGL